ncbi:MAG TPA: sigma-70 family RNA polymerase sigma factor, partial [Candidatus Limnocylindrales bacterium]|nr:sigma-70 family RNA polymerase sigma factor [Candidatus Limnocylindrales bacterium]
MDATGQIEPGGDPAAEAAERALREGLRRRDPTAWATFVGRIHRTLLRQAGRLLPSHADPQDVVQQAIYRAFSHAADYDPDRPPYPWLVAICAHECLRRRRQLGRSASPLWTRDGGGSRAQDPVEVSEARAAVQRALGRLRRRERAVVNLRFS